MIRLYLHLIAGCKIGLLVHSTMNEVEFGVLLKAANLLIKPISFQLLLPLGYSGPYADA